MKNIFLFLVLFISLASYGQEITYDSTYRPSKPGWRVLSDVGDGVVNSLAKVGDAEPYATRIFRTRSELRSFITPRAGVQYWLSEKYRQGWFEYDSSDTTSLDDDGLVLVAKNKKRYKRITDYVTPEMFGAVGDSLTDDTQALLKTLQKTSGKKVVLGPKTYRLSKELDLSFLLSDCEIIGTAEKTAIVGNFGYSLIKLGEIQNVLIKGISFKNWYINSTEDNGKSIIYSYRTNVKNLTFDNCLFTNPDAYTSAYTPYININTTDTAHYLDGLFINNCKFINIGRIGITIMNRSRLPNLCRNICINNNMVTNLGLKGDNGMFISLDGRGENFEISNNTINNVNYLGVEVIGNWFNGIISANRFLENTRGYSAFSFQSNSNFTDKIRNLLVINNYVKGTKRSNFKDISNSIFQDNVYDIKGDYAVNFENFKTNYIIGDKYISDGTYSVIIQNQSSRNRFINSTFNTSNSLNNYAVIRFWGSGTIANNIERCYIVKGIGGKITDEWSGASQNKIIEPINIDDYTLNNYANISFPEDADLTLDLLQNSATILRIKDEKSILTRNRNVLVSNDRKLRVVRNTTTLPITVKTINQSDGVTVQAGQIVEVFCDSVNVFLVGSALASDSETQVPLAIENYKYVSPLKLNNWWTYEKSIENTIYNKWTFTVPVVGTTPTNSPHLATKGYTDGIRIGVPYSAGSVAPGGFTTQSVTVPGVLAADWITAKIAMPNGIWIKAEYSTTDTVTVTFYNPTKASINPEGTVTLRVQH